MKHVDSKLRCLVLHHDEDGTLPCIVCANCGKDIRPSKMHEECLTNPFELEDF